MRACAAPRDGQDGTWITDDMIAAYCALHELRPSRIRSKPGSTANWPAASTAWRSAACSTANRCSRAPTDASKIALAHLVRQLERWKFGMIDCQMNTAHLASLGAREIPRAEFIAAAARNW